MLPAALRLPRAGRAGFALSGARRPTVPAQLRNAGLRRNPPRYAHGDGIPALAGQPDAARGGTGVVALFPVTTILEVSSPGCNCASKKTVMPNGLQ